MTRGQLALYAAVSLGSVAWTLAVVSFLSPPERVTHTTYEELIADVNAGRVDEIEIHDRSYTYRTNLETARPDAKKQAIGPEPTLSELRTLSPSNRDMPAPRIRFKL